ncbi:MAG TPA: hypothetical protein VEL79_02415 [Vicinamibacterales bacterium]|nr:hypothetical protein [Vicinamibacterales bacterium]
MRRLRLPHPLALLTACILAGAILSWVVPAGQYDRRDDPSTGKRIVVAGSFHHVDPQPVGPFAALLAVPHGMIDAASVIFFVFLVGGAFTVVEETGALKQAVGSLVLRLGARGTLVIPIVSLAFAAAGALENMAEEIIALVPVLLLVTRRLGFDAITGVAISIGAAAIGAAFSPINPFQAQIAQKLAGLALLSAWQFRTTVMGLALAVWIAGTWRHALRTRRAPEASDVRSSGLPPRLVTVLLVVIAAFTIFIYGVIRLGWDFDQMAALFFAMGLIAGFAGGLGAGGTAQAFVNGFGSMAYAAMLIGFARAIFVVLDQGRIVDTIVHGLVSPLQHLPVTACAIAMMGVQAVIHFPVPSVSGQAVLTMPLLVPVSDLIGLSRQVTVLAFQYGAGLTELVTPTNGAIVAVAAASGVKFGDWLSFAVPIYLVMLAFSAVAIGVAVLIALQ